MCVTFPSSLIWGYTLFVGVNLHQRVVKYAHYDGRRNDLLFIVLSVPLFCTSVDNIFT